MTLLVLDMNGLLADVRKTSAPIVHHRPADLVLPNRQRVYLNPTCGECIQSLFTMPNSKVVMFTSRLRKNALPVEQLLRANFPLYQPFASLYGEHCDAVCPNEPLHPMKTLDAVLRHTKLPDLKPSDVVFMDDHPHRIRSQGAICVPVETFDARYEKMTAAFLGAAIKRLCINRLLCNNIRFL